MLRDRSTTKIISTHPAIAMILLQIFSINTIMIGDMTTMRDTKDDLFPWDNIDYLGSMERWHKIYFSRHNDIFDAKRSLLTYE